MSENTGQCSRIVMDLPVLLTRVARLAIVTAAVASGYVGPCA